MDNLADYYTEVVCIGSWELLIFPNMPSGLFFISDRTHWLAKKTGATHLVTTADNEMHKK